MIYLRFLTFSGGPCLCARALFLWNILSSVSGRRVQVTEVRQTVDALQAGFCYGEGEMAPCCGTNSTFFNCRYHQSDSDAYYCNCHLCSPVVDNFRIIERRVLTFPSRKEGDDGKVHVERSVGEVDVIADLDPRVDPLYTDGNMFVDGHQYVLFLYPIHDYNGAFAMGQSPRLCERLNCWQERGFKVVMRWVDGINGASEVLDKFGKSYLHHVILGGHGNSDSLHWGNVSQADHRLVVNDKNTSAFLLNLRDKVKIGGSITLDACRTASRVNDKGNIVDGKNFFEFVASKLPGLQVVASKISLDDDMWNPLNNESCITGDNVKFIKDGENHTAVASLDGRPPNCKELKEGEIAIGSLCLSKCGWSCSSTALFTISARLNKIGAWLKTVGPSNDQFDPCNYGFSKMVCRISKAR